MITFSKSITILFCVLFLIFMIFDIVIIYKIKQFAYFMNRTLFLLYRYEKTNAQFHDILSDVHEQTRQLHESFSTLEVAYKKIHEKRMPTPQEAEQIEQTIRDLLSIEIIMSQDMTIARRDSVNRIVSATIKSYPEIDTEYLIKKAISVITTFTRNNQ